MTFAFGISQFTTQPWSFDETVARLPGLGVDALEVVEATLDDSRYAEQLASIFAAGMTISGVQPKVRTFFASRMTLHPQALDERVAALRGSIERLGRHASGVPFITNTGAHPKGDMAEAMRVVAEKLGELARMAADNGVELALEPLNPTSVNVESAIWTIDQALEVIDRSGAGNVGLCLDYWNIWQNADVAEQIARAGAESSPCRRATGAPPVRSPTGSCRATGPFRWPTLSGPPARPGMTGLMWSRYSRMMSRTRCTTATWLRSLPDPRPAWSKPGPLLEAAHERRLSGRADRGRRAR